MKKILTILLVAILASATLFAVDFSGRFRAGYKFNFGDAVTIEPWKTSEAKLTFKVSDDAGIWTINVKDFQGDLDSDDKLGANLSLNMAALLAANGVDLGDVSLAVSIGANTKMTALSAYNDVSGDGGYKFKNGGVYSTELAVGYGDLVQVKLAVDPTVKEAPIAVSALTKPVDGVAVSLAYGHHSEIYTGGSDDNGWLAEHAFGGAVNFNIGALAGLDFDLGVTVYDNVGLNKTTITEIPDNKETEDVDESARVVTVAENDINTFAAAVYGGVDVVDAYLEFRMDNDLTAKTNTFGMKTQVNFNVVENLGLDVYFSASDFSDFGGSFKVGGDVSYTVSGVEFAANLDYSAKDSCFSVTPKVIVVF